MGFRYVDDAITADVAFEAEGETLQGVLESAWEATVTLMIEDPAVLGKEERREVSVVSDDAEMLLFDLLGELLYLKDAEGVLLNLSGSTLERKDDGLHFAAEAEGEQIDPERHTLGVDIKAVTLHQFRLEERNGRWHARVVLDT